MTVYKKRKTGYLVVYVIYDPVLSQYSGLRTTQYGSVQFGVEHLMRHSTLLVI